MLQTESVYTQFQRLNIYIKNIRMFVKAGMKFWQESLITI